MPLNSFPVGAFFPGYSHCKIIHKTNIKIRMMLWWDKLVHRLTTCTALSVTCVFCFTFIVLTLCNFIYRYYNLQVVYGILQEIANTP